MNHSGTISIPVDLMLKIADLLSDITLQRPGFEIYEKSVKLSRELLRYMKRITDD